MFPGSHFQKAAAAAFFVFCFGAEARDAVVAQKFMVAAAHPLAAQAGYEVLKRGGSAVDAAVAVQMVLGLVEPESSGIGGGAFLLHWSQREKRLRAYDGRETAPEAARPERFLKGTQPMPFTEAAVGGRSVGVPGAVRMLELAHKRYGRLPWNELFEPAIRLAEQGFPLSPKMHTALEQERFLREDPIARRLYYGKATGEAIINTEYADTLRLIGRGGARMLYEGDVARDIVLTVRTHDKPSDLTERDFAAYRALEREPVCGRYREWRICSMPPPSAGGVAVLQILGILERTAFARAAPQSADALHLFAEAGRLAYADRNQYVGDPDFVPVPVKKMLEPKYLDARAKLIGPRSMKLAPAGDTEAVGTSHFSIVDASGDIVSMTTTIEAAWGSRVMVRGFLLNNQLTDFDFMPGGPNSVAGNKRPRSSMAPTIVFDAKGEPRLVVGSPGGPNIINYVAKALVGVLDWKLDIQRAIELPNFGSRNGPTLIERGSPYEKSAADLEARGHDIQIVPLDSGLQGIERAGGGWRGGADPRRAGAVRGD